MRGEIFFSFILFIFEGVIFTFKIGLCCEKYWNAGDAEINGLLNSRVKFQPNYPSTVVATIETDQMTEFRLHTVYVLYT